MSLFLFIVLIIIGMLLWPVVRIWLTVRSMQKRSREAFNEFNRAQNANRPGGWSRQAAPSKKKYQPGVGEYVEWEEVEVTETSENSKTSETSEKSRRTTKTSVSESQIVDVEWEDI